MKKIIICLILTFIVVISVFAGGAMASGTSGVYVSSGSFEMNGGTISGNTSQNGGGVMLEGGTFTMRGGTISGNTANSGGGVFVSMTSTSFTMTGGTISGNTSAENGGGVNIDRGTFIMRGGTITGNTARINGGGVYLYLWGFTKTGGTITGYNSDPNNGNTVKDESGNVLARVGHAVYASRPSHGGDKRKETTSGTGANLSVDGNSFSGTWD